MASVLICKFLIFNIINRKHQAWKYHLDAIQVMTKPQNDVGEMLSQVHSEEKQRNGQTLMNNYHAKCTVPGEAGHRFARA